MSPRIGHRPFITALVLLVLVVQPLVLVSAPVVPAKIHHQAEKHEVRLSPRLSIEAPATVEGLSSMRKTRVHFAIEHQGQVYHAWMVEDTSVPLPNSNQMADVMRWIYSRHNWLVLDPNGAVVSDDALYVRLAKAAEWARLIAVDSQWTPAGLRQEATTNDELQLLSAAADVANAVVKVLSHILDLLLAYASAGGTAVVKVGVEQGALELANTLCERVSMGEEITEAGLAMIAKERLVEGTFQFRFAADVIDPVAKRIDPRYPSSDLPISLSTLEEYYNSVKSGWDLTDIGRSYLGYAYNTDLKEYAISVVLGFPPGGACFQYAFDHAIEVLDEYPGMTDFLEELGYKAEQFQQREYKLHDGALNYRQVFMTQGIPNESGTTSPVTELYQPTISPGSVGDTNTVFTFSVNYRNSNNQVPSHVRLMINSIPIELSKVNTSDENYVDGVTYTWSSKLSQGHFYYYFETCDDTNCAPDHVIQLGFLDSFHLEVMSTPAPSVTAIPSVVPLDGISTSTIRVTVRDRQGNPVVGETVWFDADSFESLSPYAAMTDSNGVATSQYMPEAAGRATVRVWVRSVVGTTSVEAQVTTSAYTIQLSAQVLESTQTYVRYGLNTWTTYASTGETAYNKTMTLTTNRGTFSNGQQTTNVDICDGEFSAGECQGYTPVLNVSQSGPVTVMGTVEFSTGSLEFEAVVGAPRDVYSGKSVTGTGSSNDGWQNDHEAAWSSDGRYLSTVSGSQVYLWNVLNWRQIASQSPGGYPVNAIEFSPRGTYLGVVASYGLGVYRVPDLSTEWYLYDDRLPTPHSLAWSADESKLAVIKDKTTIWIYNVSSRTLERSLSVSGSGSTGTEQLLCLGWQGDWLTAAGYGGIGYIWNTNTWAQSSYDVHLDRIWSCRWSPDASHAAYVDKWQDPNYNMVFVKRSDMTGRQVYLGNRAHSVDWSPNVAEGKVAVTRDGASPTIRDMSGNEYVVLRDGGQYSISWSPTNLIAVVGGDTKIYAPYDAGKPLVQIDTPPDNTATAASSITMTGFVSDTSGIVGSQITVNGANPQPIPLGDDGQFEVTVQLGDGSNEIAVQATDTAGTSRTTGITVEKMHDDQPPSISAAQVVPGEGLIGTRFRLSVRVADSMSGVDPTTVYADVQNPDETTAASVRLYDDGATQGDQEAGDGIFTGELNSGGMAEAYYKVDFEASDLGRSRAELENGLTVLIYDLPGISNVSHDPPVPTACKPAMVSARVNDASAVVVVTLYFSVDGGTSWIPTRMSLDANSVLYLGTISPQDVGIVLYRIEATDALNYTSRSGDYSYDVAEWPSSVAPDVSIGLQDDGLALTWLHSPANQQYQVWRDTVPYFDPESPGTTTTHLQTLYPSGSTTCMTSTDHDVAGNPDTSYYYVIRAIGQPGQVADSNRVGILSYQLQPGGAP